MGRRGGGGAALLTQGGEAPGRAGVTAALATGLAAAALTHAGPRDPAARCGGGSGRGFARMQTDGQTDGRTDRERQSGAKGESLARSTFSCTLMVS